MNKLSRRELLQRVVGTVAASALPAIPIATVAKVAAPVKLTHIIPMRNLLLSDSDPLRHVLWGVIAGKYRLDHNTRMAYLFDSHEEVKGLEQFRV